MVVELSSRRHHVLEHDQWWIVIHGEALGLEITEGHLSSVFAHLVHSFDKGSVKHL